MTWRIRSGVSECFFENVLLTVFSGCLVNSGTDHESLFQGQCYVVVRWSARSCPFPPARGVSASCSARSQVRPCGAHSFLGKDTAWAIPPDAPAPQLAQSLPGSAEGGLGAAAGWAPPVFIDSPEEPVSGFRETVAVWPWRAAWGMRPWRWPRG